MKVTNILHEIAEVVLIEAEKNNFPPTIKEALKLGNLLAYTNLIHIYTLIDAHVFTSTNFDCNGQPYISGIESITIGNFKIMIMENCKKTNSKQLLKCLMAVKFN